MSRLAIGALVLLGVGALALLAELRRRIERQEGQIFALRTAERVRSLSDPAEQEGEITRLRRLRAALFSSGRDAVIDQGESFSLDEINQRLGALGVV